MADESDKQAEIASKLQSIYTDLPRKLAEGGQAFRDFLDQQSSDIDRILVPKIEGLKRHQREVFQAQMKDYKTLQTTVEDYYRIVGSAEDRESQTQKKNLDDRLRKIRAFYEEQEKLITRQGLAEADLNKKKDELEKQRQTDEAKTRDQFQQEQLQKSIQGWSDYVKTTLDATKTLTGALGITAAFNIQEIAVSQAKAGGAAGQIRGTPFGAGEGSALASGMFAGIGPSGMGEMERLKLFKDTLVQAPDLLGQTATSVVGFLANFGVTADESMKMAAKANADANVSIDQLVDTLNFATGAAGQFNVNIGRTTGWVEQLTTSLHHMGMSSQDAVTRSQEFIASIEAQGRAQGMSIEEIGTFVGKLSGAMAGMTPEKAMGLFTAVEGTSPRAFKDLEKVGSPEFLQRLYNQIQTMAGPNQVAQMAVPGAVAGLYGIGGLTVREAEEFKSIMNTAKSTKDLEEKLRTAGLATMEQNSRTATESLSSIKTINEQVAGHLQEIAKGLTPVFNFFSNDTVQTGLVAFAAAQIAQGTIGPFAKAIGAGVGLGLGGPGGALVGEQIGAAGLQLASLLGAGGYDRYIQHSTRNQANQFKHADQSDR